MRVGYAFSWKEYVFLYSIEKSLCLFIEGCLPRKRVHILPSSGFPTNFATRFIYSAYFIDVQKL